MDRRLSATMLRAIELIRKHGGIVHAEGGGTWQGDDGKHLDGVVTNTIYALEDRGYLERRHEIARQKLDSRRLTERAET